MGTLNTNGTIKATNLFINSNQVLHAGNWSSYCAAKSHAHDFITSEDEFNFVPSDFNNGVWFNYKAIGGGTATISKYIFGNGSKGYADIQCASLITFNCGTSAPSGSPNNNTVYFRIVS